MRLSDIMSHMNLAIFPEMALVIFLIVFISVAIRVYTRKRGTYEAVAALPLDDGYQASEGERHV